MTPSERFWAKVDASGDCWEWTAARNSNGYGITYAPGHQMVAHRWAYEALVGPIPEGLQLDHLCRNRPCVNPDHLEPITERQNILRGYGATARNARLKVCLRGHPLEGDNLHLQSYSRGVKRFCRTCTRERGRIFNRKRRAAQKLAA